jgi:hypothetical protein
MATLREMISSAREMVNAYSDDVTLSNEHLAFLFKNKRATYLEVLAANPRKQMPREAYQLLCLKLTPDPECEDGVVLLKSNFILPATINSDQDTEGIASVKLESIMSKWINVVAHERVPYLSEGRFNTNQIYVSVTSDRKVILFSPSNSHVFIEEVKLEVIAEDPEEADALVCLKPGEVACDFYDKKYPIPESLVAPIVTETVNELILKYRLKQDTVNNGADDTLAQNIPYYGPRRQQRQQQSSEEQTQ